MASRTLSEPVLGTRGQIPRPPGCERRYVGVRAVPAPVATSIGGPRRRRGRGLLTPWSHSATARSLERRLFARVTSAKQLPPPEGSSTKANEAPADSGAQEAPRSGRAARNNNNSAERALAPKSAPGRRTATGAPVTEHRTQDAAAEGHDQEFRTCESRPPAQKCGRHQGPH